MKPLILIMFQSPRSGKFVSNITMSNFIEETLEGFNPLDRGNLYQIKQSRFSTAEETCFNPLDRGNLYQISPVFGTTNLIVGGFNPLDRGNLYQIAQKTIVV